MCAGKKLLDWLEEQQDHIFVSGQVVEEVLRRKLDCAQTFFLKKFKDIDEIKEIRDAIPTYLLGISDEKMAEFRKTFNQVAEIKSELTKLANDVEGFCTKFR